MQTTEPYLLSVFWRDGVRAAVQFETKTVIRDEAGNVIFERPDPATELPLDLGAEVLGEINAGLVARIAELETALATALAPSASPPLLTQLEGIFGQLSSEVQEAFAASFAVVRVLVEAGRTDLARAHVAALTVPPELEEARQGIVAALS